MVAPLSALSASSSPQVKTPVVWRRAVMLVCVVIAFVVCYSPGHGHGRGGGTMNVPSDTVVSPDTDSNGVASGTLPGTSEVSSDGSARYTIPIWVPPGRRGMQPDLTLSYSSRAANGIVGVGWSLTGFSEIQRCHLNHAIDGYAAPITFDAKDPFCLDGQRLRLVFGRHGTPQATYRTERDTFVKVVIDSAENFVPTRFSVYQKDGRILRFGGSDEFLRSANRPDTKVTVSWLLAQTEDRYGNVIVFSYEHFGLGIYPKAIAYTGSLTNQQLTPSRKILFVYEQRLDVEFSAGLGFQDLARRLIRIEAYGPDEVMKEHLLRVYALVYSAPSITHRSLLSSVTVSDADGHQLPATSFDWERGEGGFTVVQTDIDDISDNPHFQGFRLLDLNGDGQDDLLYLRNSEPNHPDWWGDNPEYYVRLSVGSGFGNPLRVLQPARLDNWGKFTAPLPMLYDASEPLGLLLWATWNLSKPNDPGSPAIQQVTRLASNVPLFGPLNFSVQPNHASVIPMDMDGDGLADLAAGWFQAASNGVVIPHWHFYKNLGQHSFASPTNMTFPPQIGQLVAVGITMPMRGVDVDGDGRQELIACQATGPATPATVLTASDSYSSDLITCSDKLMNQRFAIFPDANGDGLDDVAFPTDPTPGPLADIGMTTVLNAGRNVPSVRTFTKDHDLTGGVRVIDYDLDGHPDLLATRARDWNTTTKDPDEVKGIRIFRTSATASGIQLSQSFPETAFGSPTLPFSGQSSAEFELVEVGDVNGDGLQDVVAIQNRHFVLYLRKGYRPDVLVRVVDGVGAETGFLYTPLSESGIYTPVNANLASYPQRAVSGGLLVVSEHQVANGTGEGFSTNVYDHYYEDAIEDIRGRGFLGFRAHEVVSPDQGTRVRYEYDLSPQTKGGSLYPFAGLATKETTTVTASAPDSSCGGVLRQHVIRRKYQGHVDPLIGLYAPSPAAVLVDVSDCVNGHLAPTYHQVTEQSVDEYGNVRSLTTTLGNGDQYTEVVTYDNSASDWLIDRRTRSVETSNVGGESATRTTAYRYDGKGSLQRIVVEPGDDSGVDIKPLPQPQPDGVATLFIRYDRDSNGQVTRVSHDVDNNATAEERFTQLLFDDADRIFPTSIINKAGHTTALAFHPGLGLQATAVDANGVGSRWQYDTFGRLKRSEPGTGDPTSLTYGGYNGLGVDPKKQSLELVQAGDSGWSVRSRFDVLGRRVSKTTYDRSDGRGVRRTNRFDGSGRVVATSRPHFEGAAAPALDTFKYDTLGRVTRVRSATGYVAAYGYHGLRTDCYDGEPSDPATIRTTVTTDLGGRIVSSTQHAGANAGRPARDVGVEYAFGPFGAVEHIKSLGTVQMDMQYDRLGRLLAVVDPSRGQRDYAYDAFGEVAAETIGKAGAAPISRQYVYDGLGRLSVVTAEDGATTYVWDTSPHGVGQLSSVTSPQNVVATVLYDDLGRVMNQTWQIDSEQLEIGTEYDSAGRLKRLKYPDASGLGFAIRYEYGAHGALKEIINDATKVRYWTLLESDESGVPVDPSGGFPRAELGNGVITHRIERAAKAGILGAIITEFAGKPLQDLTYEFDGKLNLHSRRDMLTGTTEVFDYDELNRLQHWIIPGQSTVRYDYDDLGNLRARIQETGSVSKVVYDYSRLNGAGPYGVTAMNGFSYSYSQEGNQITGPGRQITFTSFGLPLHIDSAGQAYDFGYDGFGSRVYKRSANQETLSIADLYERLSTGSRPQLFSVIGPQGLICQVVRGSLGTLADTVRYVHADNLGSVESVTDEKGALVEKREYDPFGGLIGFSLHGTAYASGKVSGGSVACAGSSNCFAFYQTKVTELGAITPSIGFTGHREDREIGPINMIGRIYDPVTGRFLSPDRFADSVFASGGLNPYVYVSNSPVTLVDPTGFQWDWPDWGGSDNFFLPPIDPLPPGPWAPNPGPGPIGGPVAGPTGSTPPRAPYNPVDEVGNRLAAARIDYQPGIRLTLLAAKLGLGMGMLSALDSSRLKLDPVGMASALAAIYVPLKAWPAPWERTDLTGGELSLYTENYFKALDEANAFFARQNTDSWHPSFEASRAQLGLPEGIPLSPHDRFSKNLDLITTAGPIGILFMASSNVASFFGGGDVNLTLEQLEVAKPFDLMLGSSYSFSRTADANVLSTKLRTAWFDERFLYCKTCKQRRR